MAASLPNSLLSLKPHDRVLAWLDAHIPANQRRSGVRIPTTREVSRLINVSSGTVQKVYQHLAEKGLLQTEVGSGTFWTKAAERGSAPVARSSQVMKIGMNVGPPTAPGRPESWAYSIFGGMFNAIIQSGSELTLHPASPLDAEGNERADVDELLAGIRGFISFPTPTVRQLDSVLRRRGIPHVTLNPLSVCSTTHFVSPNYFECNRVASSALVRAGRKRLLLFLSPGTEYSVSCQLRLSGFASGLHLCGGDAEFRTIIAEEGSYELGYLHFRDFLTKGWIPDAVCTAGDGLARGVLDAAVEAGISVPESMSIIGGGGGTIPPGPDASYYLTAMTQPLEQIGEQLIRSILAALESPEQAIPGINLPVPFTVGNTTRSEENRHLCNTL